MPYPGSDQVLAEMLAALRAGEIDALVDDQLMLGVAVAKTNPALNAAIADCTLAQLWAA